MNKLILIAAAIMVGLAILLPFASKTPDGLQTLVDSSATPQQPTWNGIMGGYSTGAGDPYLSALSAGLIGTAIVILASFALGATMKQKKKTPLSASA
jgi:hypothetical protein